MTASKTPIYFDYHATTPTDPRVLDAMMPFWTHSFGNASSAETSRGRAASKAVEKAREALAQSIGATPNELVFTSGATEANNLALIGGMRHLKRKSKNHLIIAVSEHKCVLEAARFLETEGVRVTRLAISPDGHLDLQEVENAIEDDTGMCSFMLANNETGVLHPLKQIADICHAQGVILHSDAAQAFGKMPVDVSELGVDMMSISAHKAYGPMGIGALYLRHRPRARVEPLLNGGGQERGLRSGTLPVPLIVGFGKAAEVMNPSEWARQRALRDKILASLPELQVNGDMEARLGQNLNLSFPRLNREDLYQALSGFDVSSGSACSDNDVAASYVLRAMGIDEQTAKSSIRICIGNQTTEAEVALLIERLKSLSQLDQAA